MGGVCAPVCCLQWVPGSVLFVRCYRRCSQRFKPAGYSSDDDDGGSTKPCGHGAQPAPSSPQIPGSGSGHVAHTPPGPLVESPPTGVEPIAVGSSEPSFWVRSLLDFFAKDRAKLGEARPLRVCSGCTGTFSEGAAFEVCRSLRSLVVTQVVGGIVPIIKCHSVSYQRKLSEHRAGAC